MSFAFEFRAKSRDVAISVIDGRAPYNKIYEAPPEVVAFIRTALTNLRHDGPVHVRANGHLCNDRSSYENSSAVIEVTPIILI